MKREEGEGFLPIEKKITEIYNCAYCGIQRSSSKVREEIISQRYFIIYIRTRSLCTDKMGIFFPPEIFLISPRTH